MSNQLTSVSSVISSLGGTQAVADLFGVRVSAIGNWRSDDRFPSHTFPTISRELLTRGLSADINLWKFDRKKPERQEEVSA
jgi:hypothetical protein